MKDSTGMVVVALMLTFVSGFILGGKVVSAVMETKAVQVGAAFYNPTNATFTWKVQR